MPKKSHSVRFKFSKARLMYWAYACINAQFKQEVKFLRDSLHKQYAVNKHNFQVVTNTVDINRVKIWIERHLKEAGFIVVSGIGSQICFEKKNNYGDTWGYVLQWSHHLTGTKSLEVIPYFYEGALNEIR